MDTISSSSCNNNTNLGFTTTGINTGSNLYYSGNSNSLGSFASGINYNGMFNFEPEEPVLKTILACLQESKIEEIMDIVKQNISDENYFKTIIKAVVRSRHFSEDFLLKYISFLDKDTIFVQHKENILSLEYHNITLALLESDPN